MFAIGSDFINLSLLVIKVKLPIDYFTVQIDRPTTWRPNGLMHLGVSPPRSKLGCSYVVVFVLGGHEGLDGNDRQGNRGLTKTVKLACPRHLPNSVWLGQRSPRHMSNGAWLGQRCPRHLPNGQWLGLCYFCSFVAVWFDPPFHHRAGSIACAPDGNSSQKMWWNA